MHDQLAWRLGARLPAGDYRVFQTAFVDGAHPRTGAVKRFSLIGAAAICLEIPGGMVDPGETPEVAAARELAEETGYTAPRWERLGTVWPTRRS